MSFVSVKQLLLTLMLLYISLYGFRLGRAQTGISGTGLGYIPQPGGGVGGGGFGNGRGGGIGGIGGAVLANALVCLTDKIYSGCGESYRLTESGELNVPHEYTDQFCGGPCFKETNLVLNCLNDALSSFLFYNRATVRDVKDTILSGCSSGPNRGDFNVAEHIQAYGSNSHKFSYSMLFWLVSLIFGSIILF